MSIKENDHEWDGSINNRSRGRSCPICSGKKLVKSNCLATLNPELAKEWHPTKNGKLTPFDVFPAQGEKFGGNVQKEMTTNGRLRQIIVQ